MIIATVEELALESDNFFLLDLNEQDYETINLFQLYEELHTKINLAEMEQFADYIVKINIEQSTQTSQPGGFFSPSEQFLVSSILIQIVRKIDTKIMAIRKAEYTEKINPPKNQNDRWYHSLIITLITGSLVYLLFYGNS